MQDLLKRIRKLERVTGSPERKEADFWALATEREAALCRKLWDVGGRTSAEAFARMRSRLDEGEEAVEINDPINAAVLELICHVEGREAEPERAEFDITTLPPEVQRKLGRVEQ
jgi:hypothetical protein